MQTTIQTYRQTYENLFSIYMIDYLLEKNTDKHFYFRIPNLKKKSRIQWHLYSATTQDMCAQAAYSLSFEKMIRNEGAHCFIYVCKYYVCSILCVTGAARTSWNKTCIYQLSQKYIRVADPTPQYYYIPSKISSGIA